MQTEVGTRGRVSDRQLAKLLLHITKFRDLDCNKNTVDEDDSNSLSLLLPTVVNVCRPEHSNFIFFRTGKL